MGLNARFRLLGEPRSHGLDLCVFVFQHSNDGRRTVEDRDGVPPLLADAIHVAHFGAEQAVCLPPDLMGCPVVDSQGAGSAADIHSERLPRKGSLEDTLSEVTSKEERIRSTRTQCGKKAQVSEAYVLRFVDHHKVKRKSLHLSERRRKGGEQSGLRDEIPRRQCPMDVLKNRPKHGALGLGRRVFRSRRVTSR